MSSISKYFLSACVIQVACQPPLSGPKQQGVCPPKGTGNTALMLSPASSDGPLGGTIQFDVFEDDGLATVAFSKLKTLPKPKHCTAAFGFSQRNTDVVARITVNTQCIDTFLGNGNSPILNIAQTSGYVTAAIKIPEIEKRNIFLKDIESNDAVSKKTIWNIAFNPYYAKEILDTLEQKSDDFLCASVNEKGTGVNFLIPECISPLDTYVLEGVIDKKSIAESELQRLVQRSTTKGSIDNYGLNNISNEIYNTIQSRLQYNYHRAAYFTMSQNNTDNDLSKNKTTYLKKILKHLIPNSPELDAVILKLDNGIEPKNEIAEFIKKQASLRLDADLKATEVNGSFKAIYSELDSNKSKITVTSNFAEGKTYRVATTEEFEALKISQSSNRVAWDPTVKLKTFVPAPGFIFNFDGQPILVQNSEADQSGGDAYVSLPMKDKDPKNSNSGTKPPSGTVVNDCK